MKKGRLFVLVAIAAGVCRAAPLSIGGIYPSLAYYNEEGECGTGAVVPWAGALWLVTYGPHCPTGSSDKLYQITTDKQLIVRPESVGGTPANRLIHRESGQLLIGSYLIGSNGTVRTIPISTMPGRLTGAARHLTDPSNKVYVTDMEEGLYELDVNTLQTRTLIRDDLNAEAYEKLFKKSGSNPPLGWQTAQKSTLYGYHGKGTCSGFGRLFYANNGHYSPAAQRDPLTPSGALAHWNPGDPQWSLVRTNQFTEITTRDGIFGNEHPNQNPVWALGWDAKSIILSVTTNGTDWSDFRLPKASHSYDGAHGWNTEWPRIREIGKGDEFLATMHGTFWKFPADFSPATPRGIRPRSNHLKVIGDFCAWEGKIVFGCDDSARNEFLNKRRAKGSIQGPAKSHSNLWFVDEPELDTLGPAIGNAFIWWKEAAQTGRPSAPYLIAGYDLRWLWVANGSFQLQLDREGNGRWENLAVCTPGGHDLSSLKGEWIRLLPLVDCPKTTVTLFQRQRDDRLADSTANPQTIALPKGLERPILHVNKIAPGCLSLAAVSSNHAATLDETLTLRDNPSAAPKVQRAAPLVAGAVDPQPSSILYVDDAGNRWRLPYATTQRRHNPQSRVCREVCTERDHFNAGGIYYELPAENAHGFAGIRPVAAHNLPILDYASWRGLFAYATPGQLHLMPIDHAWRLGKVRGVGGPLLDTLVQANRPSDAYLLNGFDRKTLTLSATVDLRVELQVDVDGWGTWVTAKTYDLKAGEPFAETLPRAFAGYWARLLPHADATLTAQFTYD